MTATRTFQYSHTIGMYAQIGRGFNNPVDVALGRDDLLYVLNRAGSDISPRMSYKRVSVCTVSEAFHGDFSHGGTADGEIMWPTSIAIDAEQRLYISDEALHRISVFDQDGQFLYKWGTKGQGEGQFDRPSGLALDADGHLLVADGLNHRVQRYTSDGQFLGQWGQHGREAGAFDLPWGIATDSENQVYVADWRNDRIQKFDAQGTHLASWGTPGLGEGEFQRPSGVAVDVDGLIYVADWGNHRVCVFDSDGNAITHLIGDSQVMSKWGQQSIDANPDMMKARRRARSLEPEWRFCFPTAVAFDPETDNLIVAESQRNRLQIYKKVRNYVDFQANL